jgi:aspartate kinase
MTMEATKTVVLKFGGSSVADLERLGTVADIVAARARAGHRVCVVVSAMGKTTDGLIALAQQVTTTPPRRELDMLLSTGERSSAALLTMALSARGVDGISFTGSQAGIITNAAHAGARILEVRPYRVQDELDAGRVVVLAGFQGVSYLKEITTLGRGGSDTTAVALAAALDADCEIYSDVDGVWTSDPRVVPEAKKLASLSHEEMQELAAAGAKVLNAQAVQFAKAKGIAIYARKTGDPGSGTVVRRDAPAPVGGVRGVAHRERLHRLRVPFASLPTLLAALEQRHLPVGTVSASADGEAELLMPPEDAHGLEAIVADVDEVRIDAVGAVSLVGQGILETPGLLGAVLEAVRDAGGATQGVTTSSFRITVLVPPGPAVGALARALHERFVPADREEAG